MFMGRQLGLVLGAGLLGLGLNDLHLFIIFLLSLWLAIWVPEIIFVWDDIGAEHNEVDKLPETKIRHTQIMDKDFI